VRKRCLPVWIIALALSATLLTAAAPRLLDRLELDRMLAQASRVETARGYALTMDFGGAASTFQVRPTALRRVRAVRFAGPLLVTFLVADFIGAARTPGRLALGTLALIAGAIALTVALASPAPAWILGAAAELLVFAGLGPLTDGMRHAADTTGGPPMYGMSDARLLEYHLAFPLVAMAIVLVGAVIVGCLILGTAALWPTLAALVMGVLAVLARIGAALKGPLPPALLTPITTPLGDLSAAVRIGWAVDGVLLAGLAGVSAVMLPHTPAPIITTAGALVGVAAARWHYRR
jgi:hypothetical protein